VQSGRISRARLHESLERRERALQRCRPCRTTGLEAVVAELSTLVTPEDLLLSGELVSLSLERQGVGCLPAGPGLNLIRVDTQLNTPQLPAMAPALLRPSAQGYRALVLDGRSPSPWSDDPEAPLALDRLGPGPVLLQLLVRGNPFRGSAGGDEPWPQVVRQLLSVGRLAGLAVYGSPYLWEQLRVLLPPDHPAAYSPGQMPQAQAQLLSALGLQAAALEGGFTD
jgi:beta-glucosidase